MTASCEWENDYKGSYMEVAILLPIILILQLILFSHSIYRQVANKRKHNTKRKLSLNILFISLQLIALYWSIIDVFRFVIDPYALLLRNSILCDITAASPKVVALIFYAIYMSLILLRLQTSFNGSYLQVKTPLIYLLSLFIVLPLSIMPILMLSWLSAPCIWQWRPIDIDVNDTFAFCSFHADRRVNIVIMMGIIWVALANIVIGAIFGFKLRTVLNLNHNAANISRKDKSKAFKLKSLVIKNSVLTMFGSFSTVLNYVLWILLSNSVGIGTIFVFLASFINCVCVALMFSSNDMYYKKLCKCCIVFCLLKMDKGYDRTKEAEIKTREKRLAAYLERYEEGSKTGNNAFTASTTELRKATESITEINNNHRLTVGVPPDNNGVDATRFDDVATCKL